MKHVASFNGKANEQFSRLGSPRKLENRTTSGLPFAIALAVLVLFASSVLLGQNDPFLGTWKLNDSKSKFVPGAPRKSETRMIESTPMGLRVSIKRVNGDGSTQEYEYTSNLCGKKYPIVRQGPDGVDTIAANLKAPNTIPSTLQEESDCDGDFCSF